MTVDEFWQFYYNGSNIPPKVYRRLGVRAGKLASRSVFCAKRFQKRLERSIQVSIAADYQLWKERRLDLALARHVLFKATEYDIFLNSEIEKQFEETIFIGLVRNGYGLCDSWKRRGVPARMAGRVYSHIAGKMLAEQAARNNYLLVRFEDMVANPLRFLDHLYGRLALPRPREGAYIHNPKGYGPGQEAAASASRTMRIVDKSYWTSLLAKNINAAAIERLTSEDLKDFNRYASGVMETMYEVRWSSLTPELAEGGATERGER
ncbi:hypothetical protein [Mesorhizobium sp. WSM2239]|uniref:Sulfotransferase family protein n=2 Tax=unclassified Mesorhizobium TaxID=325217 RepID=A0AAU8DHX9_9HYPH